MLPGGQGYRLDIRDAWRDFPGGGCEADTLRMNQYIEACVLEAPEQYYWVDKRFKTRPPGHRVCIDPGASGTVDRPTS